MGLSTDSCARHACQRCQLCCCQCHPCHWQEQKAMLGNAGMGLVVLKDMCQSRNEALLLEMSD